LTLGVVLTLGAVTGGRGQELSGSVTAVNASSLDGFLLPALPENWADLPFKLTASQSVSYNSNVNAIPIGAPTPRGLVLGDFTSTTNLGFSTRANVYGQQLYFDSTFGVIRYLHQTGFDSNVYTVSAGDNWTLTSRCSGNLGVTLSKSPAAITELVATGVNYLTTTSINETGNCAVSNGYSLLFNTGLTRDTNSNPIDAVNDVRTAMIEAGIEYAKGPGTLTVLASISDSSFTGRNAVSVAAGLATETDFHRFSLNYTRQINPNLSVSGLIGLVGVTNGFTLGLPKTLLPIYTLSMTWALTPKLSLTAAASRTVAPPTTVIANAETTYDANMHLTYQMTPKVTFDVSGAVGYSNSAFTPGLGRTGLTPFVVGATDFYTVTAGLTYAMTPFLAAGLNASWTERVAGHVITPQDLLMVNLNYRPY
jgi:hypothetical protein